MNENTGVIYHTNFEKVLYSVLCSDIFSIIYKTVVHALSESYTNGNVY